MTFVQFLSAIIILNVLLLHSQVSSFKLTKRQGSRKKEVVKVMHVSIPARAYSPGHWEGFFTLSVSGVMPI